MLYYLRGTSDLFHATINLDEGVVEQVKRMEGQFHAQADVDEILEMRDVCLADGAVQEAVRRFKLPDNMKVVCDTW